MNLTTDPWIPVVGDNGESQMVGLVEAFEHGEQIRDLAVRPHERIALMRLLICIAQAALDGPADRKEWLACQATITRRAVDCLQRCRAAFELLGNGPRFLQVKGDGKPGRMELDKLSFIDAEAPTLFDHDVRPGREHTLQWAALSLVSYQSFAAGGTVGGSFEQGGRILPQKGKNGPCRDGSAFHTFIRRENLVATIHSNLVNRETIGRFKSLTWGVPVWELGAIRLAELKSRPDITRSYLGRLAPISRAVWLADDGITASTANGLDYPNFEEGIRESTTAVRRGKDNNGRETLSLVTAADGESIRRPWRELHALTIKRTHDDGVGGSHSDPHEY